MTIKTCAFIVSFLLCVILSINTKAQDSSDHKISMHWQITSVTQYHPRFTSPYEGINSMVSNEDPKTSVTSTLFFNYSPIKNTYFVFNPEVSGGEGLSKTTGIAGFPNGEVYRVGSTAPQIFVARLYAEQRIGLSKIKQFVNDDQNQVQERNNQDYLSFIAGKFSITDFFDNSQISHDARTQFLNWSIMGNGGWDYPANTRGYTMGGVVQLFYKDWEARTALVGVPMTANGAPLQFKYNKAMGFALEIAKNNIWKKSDKSFGVAHFGIFRNIARMGSYSEALKNNQPDITATEIYGRTKDGYYASMDNHFGVHHWFVKGSYNDGQNETWAFTEIDNSIASGYTYTGFKGKRKNDVAGIAIVTNGLSDIHKAYLAAGGYGFIIGDGKLNYRRETILETYYSWSIKNKFYITPNYQLIINPAYNADRGSINIFTLRLHVEI